MECWRAAAAADSVCAWNQTMHAAQKAASHVGLAQPHNWLARWPACMQCNAHLPAAESEKEPLPPGLESRLLSPENGSPAQPAGKSLIANLLKGNSCGVCMFCAHRESFGHRPNERIQSQLGTPLAAASTRAARLSRRRHSAKPTPAAAATWEARGVQIELDMQQTAHSEDTTEKE